MKAIRLTQYSHGAGCGCKISPALLAEILAGTTPAVEDQRLLVGNETQDDAAVYDIGGGTGVVSTTDFFMPIVDDPFDFGRIAVTNAISDVYAMGGKPIMAIAILGWPVSKLGPEVARAVVDGGRQACSDVGIALAGGHSIDAPEPIFGAAVTGLVELTQLKRNDTARAGDRLYLSKPLGIGILTTAEKKGLLEDAHRGVATQWMCRPNTPGLDFGRIEGVTAMTDVTGFGLLGHLIEMCQGSSLRAHLELGRVPRIDGIDRYIEAGAVPGGTQRNFDSYGHLAAAMSAASRALLCDPQTSGGLLVAVDPGAESQFLEAARGHDLELAPIGELVPPDEDEPLVSLSD